MLPSSLHGSLHLRKARHSSCVCFLGDIVRRYPREGIYRNPEGDGRGHLPARACAGGALLAGLVARGQEPYKELAATVLFRRVLDSTECIPYHMEKLPLGERTSFCPDLLNDEEEYIATVSHESRLGWRRTERFLTLRRMPHRPLINPEQQCRWEETAQIAAYSNNNKDSSQLGWAFVQRSSRLAIFSKLAAKLPERCVPSP